MSKEIIIIGAGMAGIMAAKTLQEAGHSVKILEARERIGGRTHTNYSLGTSVDLGAAWIHGPHGNPLTPLQQQFNIDSVNHTLAERGRQSTQIFAADGSLVDPEAFYQGRLLAEGTITHQLGAQLVDPLPDDIRSQQDLSAYCLARAGELTAVQRQAFIYATQFSPGQWEAAHPSEIDWQADTYLDLPGGDVMLIGGGYNKMTDGLAQGLDVETAVTVQEIRYSSTHITIITNKQTYTCDYVVVTVPLGVLKAGQINFDPPLPAEKQGAIERIGFGRAEKLVLHFDKFYWDKSKHHFLYLGDPDTHFNSWNNVGMYKEIPILASYTAGQNASDFNSWSDGELLERAMDVLQTMFGKLPEPISYLRTDWLTDPFARGSYSFNKVGQQPEDRATLAKPIDNKLFFAGEATHTHFLGTVHGAYETGVRAAREILEQEEGR